MKEKRKKEITRKRENFKFNLQENPNHLFFKTVGNLVLMVFVGLLALFPVVAGVF
jgi:hypothetical protein